MKPYLVFLFCLIVNISYPQQNSENGYSVPVNKTIKVLLIFAERTSNFTVQSTVSNNYGEGVLPTNANDYFDASNTQGYFPSTYISKYFYQQSFRQYIVLGDYLDQVV